MLLLLLLQAHSLLDEAESLFRFMMERQLADSVHFSILIKGLSKFQSKGVDIALEAYKTLHQAAAAAAAAGAATSAAAGSAAAAAGSADRKTKQNFINTISLNALLHLCVVNGRTEDALLLFNDVCTSRAVLPDLVRRL